ncbi:MAG: CPBP family intramembrane metalloprotease [Bacteroidetes bacterium]|nr:CPBP family intramembrane metalloprotease [Bacteroidota bacterium]
MQEKQRPGIQLLMLLGIYACCMFVGQSISRIILLLHYGDQLQELEVIDPMLILATAATTHFFTHLIGFFVFLRVSNLSFTSLFPNTSLKATLLLLLPLIAIAGIFSAGLLSGISLSFFERNGFYEIVQQEKALQETLLPILIHENPAQLFLAIFTLGVLPALGEEFIYRGILQSRLMLSTQNLHFSVIVSAFIFAAMHGQPVNLLAIAALGAILGYLYAYTKNIWYGVILHFLVNSIQLVQAYFWPDQVV